MNRKRDEEKEIGRERKSTNPKTRSGSSLSVSGRLERVATGKKPSDNGALIRAEKWAPCREESQTG